MLLLDCKVADFAIVEFVAEVLVVIEAEARLVARVERGLSV